VYGSIRDGRTSVSRCLVNTDNMYTIIVAMDWERELVNSEIGRLRSTLGNVWSAYYFLLFISTNNTIAETLCNYAFAADSIFLNCVPTFGLVETVTSKNTSSAKVWITSMGVNYSPYGTLDTAGQRESFTQKQVDEFLMIQALKKANESARKYSHPEMRDKAQMRVSSQFETLISSTVFVDELTTQFISCFQEPTVGFQMYLKPFDIEVWVSLILCCSSFAFLLYVYNRTFRFSGSFSSIFFFVSSLVEASYSVPNAISNSRIFKIITLSWFLTVILFTNSYTGLMVSDVTAPVRGEILNTSDKVLGIRHYNAVPSYEMINNIRTFWNRNYTDTIKMNGSRLRMYKNGCDRMYIQHFDDKYDSSGYETHHAQFRTSESFTILQNQIDKCQGIQEIPNDIRRRFLSHPWMYSVFNRFFDELRYFKRLQQDSRYLRRLYAFFSTHNRHYPKDPKFSKSELAEIPVYTAAAIEKELVACGRSIFIGDGKAINAELAYLKTNYPRKHFYASNDTFESGWSTPIVWIFSDSGNSKVPFYFKRLFEGGVRDVLLGLRKHQYYLKRRVGTHFVQEGMLREEHFGMSGSIQTIFIISFTCLSIASLVFLLEVIYMNEFLFTLYTTLNDMFIKTADRMQIFVVQLYTFRFTVQQR
jgi:hypothetical protein